MFLKIHKTLKLPFTMKTFVLSAFELPLKIGFTVFHILK